MEGMANIFAMSCLGIFLSMIFALIRATKGPTVFDRILAVNNFGTLTVLFIGVLGYLTSRPDFFGYRFGICTDEFYRHPCCSSLQRFFITSRTRGL